MESSEQIPYKASFLELHQAALMRAKQANETAQIIRTEAEETIEISRALRYEAQNIRQAMTERRENHGDFMATRDTASDAKRPTR